MAVSKFRASARLAVAVPAGQTRTLESLKLTQFKSLEYSLHILDAAGPNFKALKMRVDLDDVSVKDQVYARTGGALNIEVNAVSDGTDFSLEIKNNEAVPVDVVATRTIL